MWHKSLFAGLPGSAKSTCGLSYQGVEQHIWGSSEETSALNFVGRTDILQPVKLSWYDMLTDMEKTKFTNDKVKADGVPEVQEAEVAGLIALGRARNIRRYRQYLYRLKNELTSGQPVMRPNLAGEPTKLETIFLDNLAPFADDFQDYVKVVYEKDFLTKEGNYNSIAFSIKYKQEITDFLRMLTDLPCHVVMSCHIVMTLDEQTAAKANFMEDTKKGIRYPKEWQPMLMGQAKYMLAGLFDYAFFCQTQESPGKANRYLMKLEADDSSVGIAKPRIQPFINPRELEFPKNQFYPVFNEALNDYLKTGKPVANPVGGVR